MSLPIAKETPKTIKLYKHQAAGADLMQHTPRYAFLFDPGIGKTMMILAGLDQELAQGRHIKTLVIAPMSVIHSAWAEDAKHFPRLTCQICHGGTKLKRSKQLQDSAYVHVWITTYQTFLTMPDVFYGIGCRRIVVDESSKIKNHSAKITEAVHRFGDGCDSAYILTGTPAEQCPTNYWAQMRLISTELTGTRFYGWANAHFFPKRKKVRHKKKSRSIVNGQEVIKDIWVEKEVIIGWTPKPNVWDNWLTQCAEHAWVLKASDCLDLPSETNIVREVVLNKEERFAYDMVEDELLLETKDDGHIDVSPTGRFTKLRQLCGGFAYVEGSAYRYGSSKIREIVGMVDEMSDEKFVIWADFTADIQWIAKCLGDAGIDVGIVDGSVNAISRAMNIEALQRGYLRALVCHPQSVAHGVTLTAARYAIFAGLPTQAELYHQARKRIHRIGQERPCFYIHLLAQDTMDAGLYHALQKHMTQGEAVKHILSERRKAKI